MLLPLSAAGPGGARGRRHRFGLMPAFINGIRSRDVEIKIAECFFFFWQISATVLLQGGLELMRRQSKKIGIKCSLILFTMS